VKILKILAVVLVAYVGLVVLFESMLGYFQPESERTIVIATTDPEGGNHERVVTLLESDGQLYVAANHWPREWYRHALENPEVRVTLDGTTGEYRAVPVHGEEYERVDREHSRSLWFKFLTGFPSRPILRLDPVGGGSGAG